MRFATLAQEMRRTRATMAVKITANTGKKSAMLGSGRERLSGTTMAFEPLWSFG